MLISARSIVLVGFSWLASAPLFLARFPVALVSFASHTSVCSWGSCLGPGSFHVISGSRARAPHVSSARRLLPACVPLHYVLEPC